MSSPPNTVYTLSNPPKTPKKAPAPIWRSWSSLDISPFPDFGEEEKDEAAVLEAKWKEADEEREVLEKWNVRSKFLTWTPCEVRLIDDKDCLNRIYQKFIHPHSRPRNADETLFHHLMVTAVLDRIACLNLHCK